MARRSFSLMLAWRYLNPRRAMLSTVAFISVMGVMFGVLVLVVVMSVYSGLEREIKGRLLGFIPHIRLEYAPLGGMRMPVEDWRETAEEVEQIDGVVEAGAFVQDALLIDINGFRPVGTFRGIDTSVAEEVAGIEAMLDLDHFPDSSADMGLDDRVVISSKIARSCAAGVGDKVRLLTLRNFEEVERVYRITEDPPVRERFVEELKQVRQLVDQAWKDEGISDPAIREIYGLLAGVYNAEIREAEQDLVLEALSFLEDEVEQPEEEEGMWKADVGAADAFLALLAKLDETDVKAMDAETLKSMREVVLPKEAEIIGVYAASQMAMTPDVFVPLHLAQELAGLGDGVQGVGVRLEDPYQAGPMA
ncbi:MAG: ABC transporter permease, partial [Verrucomicrobiota bacterium]